MLSVRREGESTLVLSGEVDLANAGELAQVLEEAPGDLVLDMSALTFIDSSGLHAIVKRAAAGHVTLLDPAPHVDRVLTLGGITTISGISVAHTT